MRVLILGGTGFLGPQIAGRLLAFSHEVTVFHRRAADANVHTGVDVIHGDRNRLDQSFDYLRCLRPDVVVDVIAFTQAQAESLVEAFRGYAGRLVVLSSGDVYRANDILFRRVDQILKAKGIKLARGKVGEFITTQEQAGFQLLIARMDAELLRLWDAPSNAPYFVVR